MSVSRMILTGAAPRANEQNNSNPSRRKEFITLLNHRQDRRTRDRNYLLSRAGDRPHDVLTFQRRLPVIDPKMKTPARTRPRKINGLPICPSRHGNQGQDELQGMFHAPERLPFLSEDHHEPNRANFGNQRHAIPIHHLLNETAARVRSRANELERRLERRDLVRR